MLEEQQGEEEGRQGKGERRGPRRERGWRAFSVAEEGGLTKSPTSFSTTHELL